MQQYAVIHRSENDYNTGVVLGIYSAESHKEAIRQWVKNILSDDAADHFSDEMSLEGSFELASSLLESVEKGDTGHTITVYELGKARVASELELEGKL